MPDWLHGIADVTGVLGFAFGIWAYWRERSTRKRLEATEQELSKQLVSVKAIDAVADRASIYRDKVW